MLILCGLHSSVGYFVFLQSVQLRTFKRILEISIVIIFSVSFQLMKFTKAILGEKLFTMMMKATFYGHFVAGEDQYKIVPTLKRLHSFGVKPILDYSVEEDISQEEAEKRELA